MKPWAIGLITAGGLIAGGIALNSPTPEPIVHEASYTAESPEIAVPAPIEAKTKVPSKPECNPNYSGCLKPDASDYDCAGGKGNGPYYTGRVRVLGYDEYGLDRDGDGVGCE